MKAMNDDDFSDDWADTKKDPQELIPGIIAHAQKYEKREAFDPLRPAFQHFLETRRDTLRLANDVFSVFTPKMTLAKVYNEVVPSAGIYKGWTVHNATTFSHLVTLTEEEKLRHPGLEERLRSDLTERLSDPNLINNVFSSSTRMISPSDDIRAKFCLKPEEMVVEYIYDDCLWQRGFWVSGTGPRCFYLSRSVNPRLAKILRRPHGVIPEARILEIYKLEVAALEDTAHPYVIEAAAKWGMPFALNSYAVNLFDGQDGIEKDMPKGIEVCRDAASLGDEKAKRNLPIFLNDYAVKLFHGGDGIGRDISNAIKLYQEAAGLGNEKAKRNLPRALNDYNDYAAKLFDGMDGLERNIPKAIEAMRELWHLGNEAAKHNLPILLARYSVKLFHGRDGIVKNRSKAIEVAREAVRLGGESVIDLSVALANYSINLFKGTDGVERNIPKAIETCREAAGLENADAIRNLPLMIAEAGSSR